MRFIKSLFFKIKARLTLKTYQRPLAVTLLTLLLINILVLIIGSFIGLALDDAYYGSTFFGGSFTQAFIGNVKWMISPNSINVFNVHDHWKMMVLAVAVIVIGMVLFSGAIIATVTTALRKFIDTKSKAKGKIMVDGHFVILNWNAKVPDIIYNLMVKGFKENIVILSEQNKEYIESEVKSLLLASEDHRKYKANLIVKEGSTLLRSNLEDISIDKASQICIMARDDMEEGEDENISNGDLLNLKTVLRLGSFDINPNCQIVVETDSDETRGQIENLSYTVASLKKLTVIPVSFNRKIGQIIAQSIVMPEISDIYEELFSFEGSEFYSGDYEGSIEDFMKAHDQAIPVYKGKAMFVLAEDEKACFRKREGKGPSPKPIKFREGKAADLSAVFIIGDNSKSEFVLENLQRSLDQGDAKFALHHYHKNENEALIADIKATEGPKKVLILSDDSVGASTYDANVFVTLIALSNAFPKRENITYITELLDSRNLSSVRDFSIKNTIISNRMMSLLITQLAMNRDAKIFFDRVLSNADGSGRANDFDIAVTPAGELLEMEEELHFESKGEAVLSFYHFSEGKIILLGTIEGEDPCFYDKNQDEKKEVVLSKDTLLVYFKYFD